VLENRFTEALQRGSLPASQLLERLDVSPATLSRLVKRVPAVERIGRARATRYALREHRAALPDIELPVYRIDARGDVIPVGRLVTLASDQLAWQPAGTLFDGLPPEVDDMKPAGFLGRAFERHNDDLGIATPMSLWSNTDILRIVSLRGGDLAGNLVVGDDSIRQSQRAPTTLQREDLAAAADAALDGAPGRSSAGGEQPKFTGVLDGQHCIIKFAGGQNDVQRRWSELLLLEHLALSSLRDAGVPAAETDIVDQGDYRFLVVKRFDRVGLRGRRPVLSLANALQEPQRRWATGARLLNSSGRLSADDARTLALFDAFGMWILNGDRHHYNVLFFISHDTSGARIERFHIAPAFDQLPMNLAPRAGGHLPALRFEPPLPHEAVSAVWADAKRIAAQFWSKAASEPRLSTEIRSLCETAARATR
jgi:hypothetical protein